MNHPAFDLEISLEDEIRVLQKAIEQLQAKKAARGSAPVVPPQIVFAGIPGRVIATAVSATVNFLRDLEPEMTAEQRDRLDQIEQGCEPSRSEAGDNVQ